VAAKNDASPVRGHADISKQLRLLDKVVRYRFGGSAELMGAWESARNVAGSFQTKNAPQSGAGAVVRCRRRRDVCAGFGGQATRRGG